MEIQQRPHYPEVSNYTTIMERYQDVVESQSTLYQSQLVM